MPMDDDQIKGLLVREIRAARASDDSDQARSRRDAINYFNGDVSDDLPSEVGRSSVVSRDLSDTVGVLLPQLLRVFTASDNMVVAEPVGAEDDAMAKEATDGLNYVFWKDNPGYRILRDTSWNALVLKIGVVKVWHDDTPEYATSFLSGLSDEDLATLEADPEVEITNQTTETVQQPVDIDPDGNLVMGDVAVHEVKLKRLKSKGRRKLDCIPTEDYLRSDDPPGTERPRFEGQRSYKTRSELIAMGFDRKTVEDLGAAGDESQEQVARNGGYVPPKNVADKSMETVELIEGYLQVDVDDDGLAETIRTYYAGNDSGGNLLDWEVWEDEGPFFTVPCDPIPHQVAGKSIADETMDIMRVKTVLWRQGLDNTYASNNPVRFVKGKIINPDALFSSDFGTAIFGEVTSSVENLSVPFVANHAYEALTYADEIIQRRTGVGRQTMALDPEALQNQTATANQNNKDAAYTQVEQIARDMAELGWKPIFRALLQLEIKHQDRARTIRMGNKAVKIDPRAWNADMDVTINVGLGTGSRDRDASMLNMVLQQQIAYTDRIGAAFPAKALDMLPFIHNTLTKFAESTGLRNPSMYWPEINKDEIEAGKADLQKRSEQGDPKMMIEKMKADSAERIQQSEQQSNQIRAQAEAEKTRADAQVKLVQAQALSDKTRLEAELAQSQLQLKQMEISAKSDTEMKKEWLKSLTALEVAEINANNDAAAQILEAQLAREAGLQDHARAVDLANLNHENSMAAQAAAPAPEAPQP